MATAEDFKIILRNETHGEIRATKFEYRDGSRWKTENMFGIDGHKKIEKDHEVPFMRDLEGIGNEFTEFRVTYQHHVGGSTWSTPKCHVTGTFMAGDNGERRVTLTA